MDLVIIKFTIAIAASFPVFFYIALERLLGIKPAKEITHGLGHHPRGQNSRSLLPDQRFHAIVLRKIRLSKTHFSRHLVTK